MLPSHTRGHGDESVAWPAGDDEMLMKNTVRGILGLVLTAAATWLAGYIVDQIFGKDEERA